MEDVMYDIEKIKKFVKEKHKGQKRKITGEDYYTHLFAVAEQFDNNNELQVIALLHDILEDTDTSIKELKKLGLTNDVIHIINLLTRKNNEIYFNYIMRVIQDKRAIEIKIEDLNDNLSSKTFKEGSLLDKYRLARYLLIEKLLDK